MTFQPRSSNRVEMRKRQQSHTEGPLQAPGHPRPNTCCLCWSGCCKCPWHPTLEEVIAWSRSFEKMMYTQEGRAIFGEFLRSEYSEENLLFWLACEDLKQEKNLPVISEKARIIYEDYVSILSPKEVSLDSRVRENINKHLAEPSSELYQEAQLQIYTLMQRDSFPRFLNSSIYRKLVDSKSSTHLET
ncbi:regulator of G-protein signaling 17-like isoform X4 [Anguilla anguilla]|uniref:regulator of G-protein signaling 17-like isoform X4 n=1 Tax=Anguilla anguilla TaxID=7936 RepID=UPI0015AF6540|nr:regulator of G-protein signaling 17-like isoform X4 [Anguilla anguilla]